ncbi:MAG: dephospho-CoA kinase [Bacteroidota bacterium]|nr:dephospho-CoA kinase [Bacteroidota bacterium]
MLKIGITGNIGSGKSTVVKIFAQLGIPVYDSDSRAKILMAENHKLVHEIQLLLGTEAYTSGVLNRAFVSQKVFSDSGLLSKLNALVHPAVFKDFDLWVAQQHAPYILKEAALLYESGSYKDLDKMIVVAANPDLRLKRSIARDTSNASAVEARMNAQMPEAEKIKRADYIIYNNENDLLIPQVMRIHNKIMQDITSRSVKI